MKRRFFKVTLLFIWLLFLNKGFSQEIEKNHLLTLKTYNKYHSYDKTLSYIKTISDNQLTDFIIYEKAVALFNTKNIKESTNLFIGLQTKFPEIVNYSLAKCYAELNKADLACQFLEKHLTQRNKKFLNEIQSDTSFSKIEKTKAWIDLWRKKEWYNKYELQLEDALYELKLGNKTEAFNLIDKLTDIRKSMHLAMYYKSKVYELLNDNNNALIAINMAISKDDENANYYLQKSVIELKLNKSKKALKSIEKAFSLSNSEIDFYLHRSKIYLKLNKTNEALAQLQLVENLINHITINRLASEIYYQANDYSKALIAINKCIATEKYNVDHYLSRAKIYSKTFTYNFAEKDYSMALDFSPFDGEIYYERALTRIEQKKYKEACSDFNKAYQFKYPKSYDAIRRYCQNQ